MAGIGIIKTVIQIIYWIGMLIGGGRKVDTGDTVAKIIGSMYQYDNDLTKFEKENYRFVFF